MGWRGIHRCSGSAIDPHPSRPPRRWLACRIRLARTAVLAPKSRRAFAARHTACSPTASSPAAPRRHRPPRSFVIPAFVNAHDHARPTASSFGAVGMPLESWILRSALRHTGRSLSRRGLRAGAFGAGRMRIDDDPLHPAERHDAAGRGSQGNRKRGQRRRHPHRLCDRGARPESGRLWRQRACSFLTGGRRSQDRSRRCSCARRCRQGNTSSSPMPSPPSFAGPKIDVQLGPAGVQWCSRPLLEAVAENSAANRPPHSHAPAGDHLSARLGRPSFPEGIVRYLRDIGFLSERLTLAHCIHARPDELEMIAASGARIVTNFSSNMHLRSGLAPIAAAHRMRLRHRRRRRWPRARRRRRRIREMRLVQWHAWRARLQADMDVVRSFSRSPSATAARPRARREQANSRRRPCRFRHHRSRSSRSRSDHAGRSARTAVRARQCIARARCRRRWTNGRQRGQLHRRRPAGDRAGVARHVPRQCRTNVGSTTCVAATFCAFAKLVRGAADLQLVGCIVFSRSFRSFLLESNSAAGNKIPLASHAERGLMLAKQEAGSSVAYGEVFRQQGDVMGALSHLRVVEIGSAAAASYCARLFADFGATVLKVEPPQGDPLRHAAPLTPGGHSAWFAFLNFNKSSVAIDSSDDGAASRLAELIAGCDILVDGRDIDAADCPAIDLAALKQRRPRPDPCRSKLVRPRRTLRKFRSD